MYPDKSLVLLFHGIGASAAQLAPLVASYQTSMSGARLVVPNAPFRHRYGYEWFSVEGNPLAPDRIQSARGAFDHTVKEIVVREGFENTLDRVAFVGVSQGAIVSLDAVASGRWQVGAVVSFAGLLPPVPVSPISNRTPALLVHGQDDQTIPPLASTLAASQVRTAGFQVELEILASVGHTISPGGADRAMRFLQNTVGRPKPLPIPKASVA